MAKKKVSAFTATTDMGEDDCFPVVIDIGSTPKSRRIALQSLRNRLYGQSVFVRPTGGDDTATINAALAALSPGTRVMMRGSYSVSDTFTLSVDDTIMDLDGATFTQTGTTKKTLTLNAVERCKVLGGKFVGKGTETPWAGGATAWNGVAGIYITACTDLIIEDCHLTNHAGGGIQLHGVCDGIRIDGNTISGMGSESISLNDNAADGAIGSAATIAAKDGLVITNNYISDHAHGIFATTGQGMLISNNVIRDIPGQHGIYIQQGGDMTVAGNSLYNIAENGIKLQNQNATDVEAVVNIVGNSLSKCGDSGVAVMPAGAGDGYYTKNCSIIGNNIYDCTYGIYVKGAHGIFVSSNRIRKSDYLGFYIWDTTGTFVDNHVQEIEGAAFNIYKPQDRLVISGTTVIDAPINAGASSGTVYRVMAYVDDEASPNNGKVIFSNTHWRFEDYSQPANLLAALHGSANGQIIVTGAWLNETTVANGSTASLSQVHYMNVSATPNQYTNRAALYAADVTAGNTAIHAMTETGKIIKLYQQAHIADAAGGTEVATINAILAALENIGFLATS